MGWRIARLSGSVVMRTPFIFGPTSLSPKQNYCNGCSRSWQIGPTFAPSRISTSFDQPSVQRHPVAEEKGVLGEKSAPL
jgi:hypothetical protein